MQTRMPNEEVQPIKIVISQNHLEITRSQGMDGVSRQTLHRLVDEWFDHQVRTAWGLSVNTEMLKLLDKQQGAGA